MQNKQIEKKDLFFDLERCLYISFVKTFRDINVDWSTASAAVKQFKLLYHFTAHRYRIKSTNITP